MNNNYEWCAGDLPKEVLDMPECQLKLFFDYTKCCPYWLEFLSMIRMQHKRVSTRVFEVNGTVKNLPEFNGVDNYWVAVSGTGTYRLSIGKDFAVLSVINDFQAYFICYIGVPMTAIARLLADKYEAYGTSICQRFRSLKSLDELKGSDAAKSLAFDKPYGPCNHEVIRHIFPGKDYEGFLKLFIRHVSNSVSRCIVTNSVVSSTDIKVAEGTALYRVPSKDNLKILIGKDYVQIVQDLTDVNMYMRITRTYKNVPVDLILNRLNNKFKFKLCLHPYLYTSLKSLVTEEDINRRKLQWCRENATGHLAQMSDDILLELIGDAYPGDDYEFDNVLHECEYLSKLDGHKPNSYVQNLVDTCEINAKKIDNSLLTLLGSARFSEPEYVLKLTLVDNAMYNKYLLINMNDVTFVEDFYANEINPHEVHMVTYSGFSVVDILKSVNKEYKEGGLI